MGARQALLQGRAAALAAHAAARACTDPAAVAAARAAGHAIAVGHVATHAPGAPIYALRCIAAARPGDAAALAREQAFHRRHLPPRLHPIAFPRGKPSGMPAAGRPKKQPTRPRTLSRREIR